MLAIAATTTAGCGETVIDVGKAERFIADVVDEQAGVRVKAVTCPQDVKAVKGDTFDCQVVATDDTKGAVKVVQRDDEGNVNVSAPFLHTREAEASIAAEIKKQTDATVTVACPEIIVPRTGATHDCTGTDGSRTRTITLTLTDDKGNFRFRVA